MTLTAPSAERLAVVDERSPFAVLVLAWRSADEVSDAVERRRSAIGAVASAGSLPDRPVEIGWSRSGGADYLTAIVPESAASRWSEQVIEESLAHERHGLGRPVLAVVGPSGVVDDTAQLSTAFGQRVEPEEGLRSVMRQTWVQGYEQTRVSGRDPAPEVGHAATFVALSRIAGGPGSAVPDALHTLGNRAHVQTVRGLVTSRSAVTWHLIAPVGESLQTLEVVLAAADPDLMRQGDAALARARDFARANLSRSWRSPQTLARALAEYEIMGWGGNLIKNPDVVYDVDVDSLARATTGLVRPIAEVLGWE